MKVFIFGAGASVGSQYGIQGVELQPPVTDGFFNAEYKPSAEKVGLTEPMMDRFKDELKKEDGNLELWLTKKWDQAKGLRDGVQKDRLLNEIGFFTFYSWHLLRRVSDAYSVANRYGKLISKMNAHGENTGYITFNYDTLLDQALAQENGVFFKKVGDYARQNYFKLHGSVNWLFNTRGHEENVANAMGINEAIERFRFFATEMYRYDEEFKFDNVHVYNPDVGTFRNDKTLSSKMADTDHYFPMMFIPTTTKLYGLVDEYEIKLLNPALDMLRQAEHVFVIGYQAKDEIAKEMIQALSIDKPVRTVMHDHGGAVELAERIKEINPGLRDVRAYDGDFQNFVDMCGTEEFYKFIQPEEEQVPA